MSTSALILMATYNGEKFISQQIDSIISQSYCNWKLIIRDDGSTDSTMQLLNYYADIDSRIYIMHNESNQHGAYSNFWYLMHYARDNYSDFDYYFFSDQDDIWEKNKLETMISRGETFSDNIPLLLYGDMRVINQNDEIVFESLNDTMGIGNMRGYSLFFSHGFLWGCDICVNKKLFCSMPLLPLENHNIAIMSHDNYMGKYALSFGTIQYLDKVLISHRRHDSNTTGGYYIKLNIKNVIDKVLHHMESLSKTHARVYNQTLVFLKMCDDNGLVFERKHEIESAIRKGGLYGCFIMAKNKVKRKQLTRTIGIYYLMAIKKYRKYIEA